jgi:hypothetical protein
MLNNSSARRDKRVLLRIRAGSTGKGSSKMGSTTSRALALSMTAALTLSTGCASIDLGAFVSARRIAEHSARINATSGPNPMTLEPLSLNRLTQYAAALEPQLSVDDKRLLRNFPGLLALKRQVDKMPLPGCRPVPDDLAASPITKSLVRTLQRSTLPKSPGSDPNNPDLSATFSRFDAADFTELLSKGLLHPDERIAAQQEDCHELFALSASLKTAPAGRIIPTTFQPSTKPSPTTILIEYFKAFLNGNFVDRNGVRTARPAFNNGISADTINAGLTVLLEAIVDIALDTPVFIAAYDSPTFSQGFVPLPNAKSISRCIPTPLPSAQLLVAIGPTDSTLTVNTTAGIPFRTGVVEVGSGATMERIRIKDRIDATGELIVAANGRGVDRTTPQAHAKNESVIQPDQFFVAGDVRVNANSWQPGCLTAASAFSTTARFLTAGGATPTAAIQDPSLMERVVVVDDKHRKPPCKKAPDGTHKCGISEGETGTISFLGTRAGTGAQALGGVVFRTFGGLELSYVFGGHFSIGNNETLGKVVDTLLEVITRRAVEEATYLVLDGSQYEITLPIPAN